MAYRQATKPIQETSVVAVEILRVKSVEEALRFYEVHYEALPAIEQEKVPEKSKEWPVFLVNSLIEKMQEKWKRTSGPTLVSNKETKMPGVNISDRKKDIVAYLENHRGEYEGKSVEEIFALLEKNNRLFNPSLRGVKYLTKRNNQPYSEKIMQEANKQNFWLSFVSVNEWFEGPNSNK
jgi:hypothetical protein